MYVPTGRPLAAIDFRLLTPLTPSMLLVLKAAERADHMRKDHPGERVRVCCHGLLHYGGLVDCTMIWFVRLGDLITHT